MAAVTKPKCDWAQYNEALVNRGDLTIFVSKDFAREWYVKYDANTPNLKFHTVSTCG